MQDLSLLRTWLLSHALETLDYPGRVEYRPWRSSCLLFGEPEIRSIVPPASTFPRDLTRSVRNRVKP